MKDTIAMILTMLFFMLLQLVAFLITPNNWIRVVTMPILIGVTVFVLGKKFGIK